jgi:hypothetical protein
VSLMIFSLVLCWNCASDTKNEKTEISQKQIVSTTLPKDSTKYPNDDSELALLMREMYTDSDSIKQAVLANKEIPDFRKKFKILHSAKPTDAETKHEGFDAMGASFLENMDKVYTISGSQESSKRSERIKAFNIMVQNCVGCHQSHCPGPIKKIKKLTISQ